MAPSKKKKALPSVGEPANRVMFLGAAAVAFLRSRAAQALALEYADLEVVEGDVVVVLVGILDDAVVGDDRDLVTVCFGYYRGDAVIEEPTTRTLAPWVRKLWICWFCRGCWPSANWSSAL
jgi:hypothetical protein